MSVHKLLVQSGLYCHMHYKYRHIACFEISVFDIQPLSYKWSLLQFYKFKGKFCRVSFVNPYNMYMIHVNIKNYIFVSLRFFFCLLTFFVFTMQLSYKSSCIKGTIFKQLPNHTSLLSCDIIIFMNSRKLNRRITYT